MFNSNRSSTVQALYGRIVTFCFPTVLCFLCLVSVARAAPELSDGYSLYRPCVVCHAPQAWGSLDGDIPSLAGQQKRYLEKQLAIFRSGARLDDSMQVVTAHSEFKTSQAVAAIASYLAALDTNPNPVKGMGDHLQLGREIFEQICAACHASNATGNRANTVPRIAGQQYPYLRRRIEDAARLHMDLAPPEMTSALRGMGSQEKNALADYISRMNDSQTSQLTHSSHAANYAITRDSARRARQ